MPRSGEGYVAHCSLMVYHTDHHSVRLHQVDATVAIAPRLQNGVEVQTALALCAMLVASITLNWQRKWALSNIMAPAL